MVAAASLSWTHILTQVAASLDGITDQPSAEVLMLKPTLGTNDTMPRQVEYLQAQAKPAAAPIGKSDDVSDVPPSPAPPNESVADWMSTLDIINGIAGLADEHKRRFEEYNDRNQTILLELQQELRDSREQLQAEETRIREMQARADIRLQRVQADADAQVQKIRAEAETRVRTIRAEAEVCMQAANDQVRVADLRAATAEQWLQRIDTAVKNLLLGGHIKAYRGNTEAD